MNKDRNERETLYCHLSLFLPPPTHTSPPHGRPRRPREKGQPTELQPSQSWVQCRGNKATRCDSASRGTRQGREGRSWGRRACTLAIQDFRAVLGSPAELCRLGAGRAQALLVAPHGSLGVHRGRAEAAGLHVGRDLLQALYAGKELLQVRERIQALGLEHAQYV